MEELDKYILTNFKYQHGDRFEGNISSFPQQIQSFKNLTSNLPPHSNLLEIGFNAGHSSALFLDSNPTLTVTSFDLGGNAPSVGKSFIDKKYPNRHTLIVGNSSITIPLHNKKYNVIFIDGDHEFVGCLLDITNCKQLAHKDTIILLDDITTDNVNKAWEYCKTNNIVTELSRHVYENRGWLIGKYII